MFGQSDIYCAPNNKGKQKDWTVHHLGRWELLNRLSKFEAIDNRQTLSVLT